MRGRRQRDHERLVVQRLRCEPVQVDRQREYAHVDVAGAQPLEHRCRLVFVEHQLEARQFAPQSRRDDRQQIRS
jgi:hypothetical protein